MNLLYLRYKDSLLLDPFTHHTNKRYVPYDVVIYTGDEDGGVKEKGSSC